MKKEREREDTSSGPDYMAVGPERRVNQLNVVGHATVLPLIAIPGPLKVKKHQDFIGCPRIVGDQTTTAKAPQ